MPFKPKIIGAMKSYSKKQLLSDAFAGLMVAIITMPLSLAVAAASGVDYERGIYASVFAGFIVALLGGSNVNITGPTAAFITIVYGIVTKHGIDGLIAATIMAGIILILMGALKLGSLVKYIPLTITTGFYAGLSISIIVGQIKHLFGLTLEGSPIEGIDKLDATIKVLGTFNFQSFIIGALCLAVMILLPKWTKKVPPTVVALALGSAIVLIFKPNVETFDSVFGKIELHAPRFPDLTMDSLVSLVPEAFIIAMVVAIESMLSSVISDGMINDKTNSNTELIALGVGNIVSGFFGGIPATGAIARTTVNIKNGGRTPISAMVHSVVILLFSIILFPLAKYIPMPTISAILIVTAFSMADWKRFTHICKNAANAEITILIATFILTVIFNPMVAIAAGLILTAFLFLKEMADSANVRPWTGAGSRLIPEGSAIYELNGPMFFAATDKLLEIHSKESGISVIILRASHMTLLDIEAIRNLEKMVEEAKKNGVTVIISHAKDQPLRAMQKVGLVGKIGEENFCDNINLAIERAEAILEENKKAAEEKASTKEKSKPNRENKELTKIDVIEMQTADKTSENMEAEANPETVATAAEPQEAEDEAPSEETV